MHYIKGYVLRQAGPFIAKEHFEGLTREVEVGEDHVIVMGVSIPKDQIVTMERVSATRATLSMPGATVEKKAKIDEGLREFDRYFFHSDLSVALAISKWEGKKVLPVDTQEDLKRQAEFLRAVMARSCCDRERRDSLRSLKAMYAQWFAELKRAPKVHCQIGKKK